MPVEDANAQYALGFSTSELDRLKHQALMVAPCTERLFREAGICTGQRILDVGSGGGDVCLLLAQLVGTTGSVVGLERNAETVQRARTRIAALGITNISIIQSDVTNPSVDGNFDAVVGRFILMYLPEPARALRNLAALVRSGGAMAFLEPSWAAARGVGAHLPFYSACANKMVEAFRACGANPDMGLALPQIFSDASLPAPVLGLDMKMGSSLEYARAPQDILHSLAPQAIQNGVSFEVLGDLNTLAERLQSELQASNAAISWLAGHVGGWCRKTDTARS